MLDLTIIGITLQGEGSSPGLLLHVFGTDRLLVLPLSPTEAFSLSGVLHGPAPGQEPNRRDLTARILHALGGRLQQVEFSDFGLEPACTVVILSGSTSLRLRCRPAEGAQLALYCGAPLKADESALRAGKTLEDPALELPAHVRALVRTAVLRDKLEDADGFDFSHIPLILEGRSNREAARPAEVQPERRAPRIQISFKKIENPASPGVPAPEAKAGQGEEDRWAALLQVLSPETKTLM